MVLHPLHGAAETSLPPSLLPTCPAIQATDNQPVTSWAVTDGSGRKALPVAGPSPTALEACGAAVYVIDKVGGSVMK